MPVTRAILFHGTEIVTVNVKGKPYVAMKPIVEALGLAWQVQQRKIASSKRYNHMVIPIDGQEITAVDAKGRQVRRYFIEIEKRHNEMADALADAERKALLSGFDCERKSLLGTIRSQEVENSDLKKENKLLQRLTEINETVREFGELASNGLPKTIYRRPTYAAPADSVAVTIPAAKLTQLRLDIYREGIGR